MMNTQEKFLAFILAMGIMFLILGFANVAGATPSGGYGQPFYTKTQQGKSVVAGRVSCDTDGADFGADFSDRASLIMRNIGTETVYICPASASTCIEASFEANSMYLKTDDALILDKATNIGSTGWKCFTKTSTANLHYLTEQ